MLLLILCFVVAVVVESAGILCEIQQISALLLQKKDVPGLQLVIAKCME
jgi:hypothetical protein